MELRNEIKQLIIDALELEEISPSDIKTDEPLFNDGLGLDSIDALELGMVIKNKYKLKFSDDKEKNKKIFTSVETLAQFIEQQKGG